MENEYPSLSPSGYPFDILGNMRPMRGDIVFYHGKHFFFQPLGSACALYDNANDIGNLEKAKHKPNLHSVFLLKSKDAVTEADKIDIIEGKHVQLDNDERENSDTEAPPNREEHLWLIIDALLDRVARLELKMAQVPIMVPRKF